MGEGEVGEGVGWEGCDFEALFAGGELAANGGTGVGDEDGALSERGVGAEQAVDADEQAGLLFDLAGGGGFEDLSGIDEAGGEGPAAEHGLVSTLAKDDAAIAQDDDADRDLGVIEVDAAAALTDGALLAEGEALLEPGAAAGAVGGHRGDLSPSVPLSDFGEGEGLARLGVELPLEDSPRRGITLTLTLSLKGEGTRFRPFGAA